MDDIDIALLQHLQENARITNRELAEKVHLSASTCLERVKRLKESGIIVRFTTEISKDLINRELEAFVSAKIRPLSREVISNFQAYLIAREEVLGIFLVSGDDDLIIHVAVRDVRQLHDFLVDNLSQREEVLSFRSSVIYHASTKNVINAFAPA